MFRDTASSTRCIIKLARAVRRKQAMSDLVRSILSHGLIGTGGGLATGMLVGKDSSSPFLGAGIGALAGGAGGAADYFVRKAKQDKAIADQAKLESDVAMLSAKLGIDPKVLKRLGGTTVPELLEEKFKGNEVA